MASVDMTKEQRLKELYVKGGIKSYVDFAKSQGLAHSTIKSYACRGGWTEAREKYWDNNDKEASQDLTRQGSLSVDELQDLIERELLSLRRSKDKHTRDNALGKLITFWDKKARNVMLKRNTNEAQEILQPILSHAKCNILDEIKQGLASGSISDLGNLT